MARTRPHGGVLAWLESVRPARLCLSVVTLGELQAGIERTREHDPGKVRQIDEWADAAIKAFEILVVDAAVIRLWAKLMHRRSDNDYEDAMIAATALVHGLTMVTRDVRDFQRFGVDILNPFNDKCA